MLDLEYAELIIVLCTTFKSFKNSREAIKCRLRRDFTTIMQKVTKNKIFSIFSILLITEVLYKINSEAFPPLPHVMLYTWEVFHPPPPPSHRLTIACNASRVGIIYMYLQHHHTLFFRHHT